MPTPHDFSPIFQALNERRFFKLICGGSFSDTTLLKQLIDCYTRAGVQLIDISAKLSVLEAACETLETLQSDQRPQIMVSFPLDEDPHFRKIKLTESDCISCGACLPVCPTEVFSLDSVKPLIVDEPRCYGCNRCVPICPTEALSLDPFSVHPHLKTVLEHPAVSAVEIHSSFADPALLDSLYADLGNLLKDKLIALCFRPQLFERSKAVAFIEKARSLTPYPLIVQVDGIPMSGNDDPKASRPALDAARDLAPHLPRDCYLTVSGGINQHTAALLAEPAYQTIQGVGMGTSARQWVWQELGNPKAVEQARAILDCFQATLIKKSPLTSTGVIS